MKRAHEKSRYFVVYDGDCGFCTRFMKLLRRLDLLNRLQYVNFREPSFARQNKDVLKRLEGEMLLVSPSKKQYWGFFTWRKIATLLPPLWIFVPFVYLPFADIFGSWIYAFISNRRYSISRIFNFECQSCGQKHRKN